MTTLDDYNKAIKLNPNDADAYNGRGIFRFETGDYQGAIEDYTKVIELKPKHSDAYCIRGLARSYLRDYQGAIEDHTQAIKLNPNDACTYNNRGNVRFEMENYQEAIGDFTQAIKLDPDESHYYNRGNARFEMGDYQGALEDYNLVSKEYDVTTELERVSQKLSELQKTTYTTNKKQHSKNMIEKLTQLKKLAYTPFTDIKNLPASPGIYFAVDGAYRVWYVGIASNLRDRHMSHEKKNQFLEKKCWGLRYFLWDDMDDLQEWEDEAIHHYQPPLNQKEGYDLPLVNLGYEEDHYFDRYNELKEMEKAIKEELEQLKPNIVSILENQNNRFRTDKFYAYLNRRRSYQYSDEVEQLSTQLKVLRKREEEQGIALVTTEIIFPVVRMR